MNGKFHMPVRVVSGRGCLNKEGMLMAELGTRALVVTGRRSARACGALPDVEKTFAASGIFATLFEEVEPNPSIATIRRAAKQAQQHGADFIVGIGGGSPLDAAKAIALLAANELEDEALFGGPWPKKPLPIVAVPTTSGTGSEVTQYAILTDDRAQSKRNLASPLLFPALAFCDPAYTDNLPRLVTIHTAVDALSHSLEGFVSKKAQPMTDSLAREAFRLLGPAMTALAEGDPDASLRDTLQLCSTLGGMVIAQTGTTALHALGYSLTYFRDIDHGRANGLLMAPYLAFVSETAPARVAEALQAMGFPSLEELAGLLDVLLGEKESLSPQETESFAAIASQAANLPNTLRLPTREELAGLYQSLAKS